MAVAAALAWWASGPRGAPLDPTSPGRLFVLFFLATTGIGTLVITATGEASGAGALVAAGGLAAFAVGAAVGARLKGVPAPIGPPAELGAIRTASVVGLALVGLLAYAWLAAQYGIPFLTGDAQTSRAGFAGPAFDLFRWLVPPAALVAVGRALARPGRHRWLVAAGSIAGVGVIELLTASRALPLELGLAVLLLAWWAGRRLSRRVWLSLAVVALAFFVGVQLLRVVGRGGFTGPADVGQFAVGRTFDRVVLIQARTLELVASQIPSQEPYFLGSTYVRWLAPLRGEAPPKALGYWIYERLYPEQPGGFATPGILGELWANGGIPLALGGMALFGLAIQGLGRLARRLDRGVADRALAALLVIAIARSYATSLDGLLLTAGVMVAWRVAVTLPALPAWLPLPRPGRRQAT